MKKLLRIPVIIGVFVGIRKVIFDLYYERLSYLQEISWVKKQLL